MKNKKRYFYVVYRYPGAWGAVNVTSEEGGYINQKKLIEDLKSYSSGIKDFVITNIIELSEEDYNYFCA